MMLWVLLFLIIVGLSFVLAMWSMKDYQEIPQEAKTDYSLFLVRNTNNFNATFLDTLQTTAKSGQIISLERLFKGTQSALAIFGPKIILEQYTTQLNLLELEDYAQNLSSQDLYIWEMGSKGFGKLDAAIDSVFKNLPALDNQDQFFWQVVLGVKKGKDIFFPTQIRAATYSSDQARRNTLVTALQDVSFGGLVKVPTPFSQAQLLDFYKLRSLSKDSKSPVLKSAEIVTLVKIP